MHTSLSWFWPPHALDIEYDAMIINKNDNSCLINSIVKYANVTECLCRYPLANHFSLKNTGIHRHITHKYRDTLNCSTTIDLLHIYRDTLNCSTTIDLLHIYRDTLNCSTTIYLLHIYRNTLNCSTTIYVIHIYRDTLNYSTTKYP